MDTQRQNFWKESIEKEAMVRLMWYEKYGHELKDWVEQDAEERPLDKLNSARKTQVTKLPSIPVKKYHKKKAEERDTLVELATSLTPDSVLCTMRPVTPITKVMLYKGFSKEGKHLNCISSITLVKI